LARSRKSATIAKPCTLYRDFIVRKSLDENYKISAKLQHGWAVFGWKNYTKIRKHRCGQNFNQVIDCCMVDTNAETARHTCIKNSRYLLRSN